MKTLSILLALTIFSANLSFAELNAGDHVIYRAAGGRGTSEGTSRVGTVISIMEHNKVMVQETSHSGKYGLVTVGGTDLTNAGLAMVDQNSLILEVARVTRPSGETLQAGSKVKYRLGRGPSNHPGRVVYAFSNGQVGVVSEEEYQIMLRLPTPDAIFNQQPTALVIR